MEEEVECVRLVDIDDKVFVKEKRWVKKVKKRDRDWEVNGDNVDDEFNEEGEDFMVNFMVDV